MPSGRHEAVATLIYADARLSELQELRDLRRLFTDQYGDQMEQFVNAEFIEKQKKSFSTYAKLYMMQKIAELYYLTWDCKAFEQKLSSPPASAMSPRKEVNVVLKKEANYFGDIVILTFMDRYELVLKTITICEHAVHNLSAAYIMKCDYDTFVRLDVVLKEIQNIARKNPLYMGNLNLLHMPLRTGKWAVTFEERPEEIYPSYANGPGYIISSDIARHIIARHANQSLRLFKMEDVSMGMWVEEFNTSTVQYSHNWKFCQYGCT